VAVLIPVLLPLSMAVAVILVAANPVPPPAIAKRVLELLVLAMFAVVPNLAVAMTLLAVAPLAKPAAAIPLWARDKV